MTTFIQSPTPLQVFRFSLSFKNPTPIFDGSQQTAPKIPDTGFAECSGLEATMEPKVIKEGGRNFGAAQRAGPVTFGTVILKRGMVRNLTLWQWFTEATSQGLYGRRRDVEITLHDSTHPTNGADARRPYKAVVTWQLRRALPIKVKTADLNAKATELGVEELHLAHEGMRIQMER
ncbi:MAG: phage tail protein [Gemmatimonadetes bacterium]|nr:MAG: phage tail protein [Gemmatimonadota bacterium]